MVHLLQNDGRFMLRFAHDTVNSSIKGKLKSPSLTIFQRKYDLICPLPTSIGHASNSNMAVDVIASAFNDHGCYISSPIEIVPIVERFVPMKVKYTAEDRDVRRSKDAARIMHYDTMRLDPNIPNTKIKAARNLLLMAGAAEVDVITCFCNGDVFRSSVYERTNQEYSSSSFKLLKSTLVAKEQIEWEGQENLREWHQIMKEYIKRNFPEFVPNDIPWV